MNDHKDVNEQRDHYLQLSFLQFLQAMRVYPFLVIQTPPGGRPNQAEVQAWRLKDFIRSLETCEVILARIPDGMVSPSPLAPHVHRLEKNIHELVRLLHGLPFTRDEHERLMASIDHQMQAIREDFWEALECIEARADFLKGMPLARKVQHRPCPVID